MHSLSIYLDEKYTKDKETVANEGIKGYKLTAYSSIARKIHGLQAGIMSIIAKSNIGKTVFETSFGLDLIESNPDICVAFYTFDDSKDKIVDNLISNMTNINKSKVNCNWNRTPSEDKQIRYAFDQLIDYSENGRLDIKEFQDIKHVDDLIADIREKWYWNKELVVIIDGIALLQTNEKSTIESENYKSMMFKHLCNELGIPIILTLELPKNAFHRPTRDDGKNSGRYAYDAQIVVCISEIDELHKEAPVEPALLLDFDKNKFGTKFIEYADMIGQYARYEMVDTDIKDEYKKRMLDYDNFILKRRYNK